MFITVNNKEMNTDIVKCIRKVEFGNVLQYYILEQLEEGISTRIELNDPVIAEVSANADFFDTDYGLFNLKSIASVVVNDDFYINESETGITTLRLNNLGRDVVSFRGNEQNRIAGLVQAIENYVGSTGGGGSVDLSNYFTKTETQAEITNALASETDEAVTGASFDAATRKLTLTKTEGADVVVVIPGVNADSVDIATDSTVGVVKGGGNVTIAADGQMDVDLSGISDNYVDSASFDDTQRKLTLTRADSSTVEVVIPGASNIDIATTIVAGTVKGGGNVTIAADGEMNVDLSGISTDLSNYDTKAEVDAKIAAIPDTDLSNYDTKAEVDAKIAAIPGTDLSNYDTKAEVDAKISALVIPDVTGLASETYVDNAVDALVDNHIASASFDGTSRKLVLTPVVGDNLEVVIPGTDANSIDIATDTSIGVVKGGSNVAIAADGQLSVDLTGLASETFVTNAITAIDYSSYATKTELDNEVTAIEQMIAGMGKYRGLVNSTADLDTISDINAGDYAFVNTANGLVLYVYHDAIRGWDDAGPVGVNVDDFLTEAEIDAKIAVPINRIDTELNDIYTKTEVDAIITALPTTDLSNYDTKAEVDAKIAAIPDTDLSNYDTKAEVDAKIAAIPDTDLSNYDTKAEVDAKISALVIPDVTGLASETYVDNAIDGVSQVVIGSMIEIVEGSTVPAGYLVFDGADLTSANLTNTNIPSAIRTKGKTPDSRVDITYSDTDAEFVTTVKCMYIG